MLSVVAGGNCFDSFFSSCLLLLLSFSLSLGDGPLPNIDKIPSHMAVNPIALRNAKIVCNFGISECSRVKLSLSNKPTNN